MKPSTIKLKNPKVLDDSTGAVLSAIANAGLYHRTLVVVASDNGGSTSDGGNNLPLRGGKRTLFEGGVHVSQSPNERYFFFSLSPLLIYIYIFFSLSLSIYMFFSFSLCIYI